MITRESWYREARNGEEVAADLIHAPEGMEEELWGELWVTMFREGVVPESLVKEPTLYPRLVPDFVLPLFLKERLRSIPGPLVQYALFQADLEDEDVEGYLLQVGEGLSENGDVSGLEKIESRLDQLSEVSEERDPYDKFIFVARLISWGFNLGDAEQVLKSFLGPLNYHVGQAKLRDFEARFAFAEAAQFDYGYLNGMAYHGPGDLEEFDGDALQWRLQNSDTIDVWSTFSEYFQDFPDREFWLALHDADSDQDVRWVMGL